MPSTYDPILRVELQATGENRTTWGIKNNNVITLLAEAIAGQVSVNVAGSGSYALITTDASTDEARQMLISFNGVLTGNRDVFVPQLSKSWYVRDNTSGAYGITVRTSLGTGVSLSRAGINHIVCDSVSVYFAAETNRVNKAGDTMTGPLALPTSAVPDDANAVRADYVRSQVSVVQTSISAVDVRVAAVSASVGSLNTQVAAVSALVSANTANIALVSAAVSSALVAVSAKVAKAGDTMTGALGITAGTTALPGLFFSGDTDTGLFSPAANTAAVAAGGVEVYRVDNGGRLMVGATSVKPGYTSAGDITLPAGAKVYGLNLPKAWINFNGNTAAIRASFNVTSVTRSAVGRYLVTFTNAMADSDYVLVGNATGVGASHQMLVSFPDGGTKSTTQCNINTMYANIGNADSGEIMCVFFGN